MVMRSWSTREAKVALAWAAAQRSGEAEQCQSDVTAEALARELDRTPKAVKNFLRRALPPGRRPWPERPRWDPATADGSAPDARSTEAVRKFRRRHSNGNGGPGSETDPVLSISQVARDLGVSRAFVYRLLDKGLLRRFHGGIAESTFTALLRDHSEVIPYRRLSREQREWLVLSGYPDSSIQVKQPSTRGLLK